jgi:hypothetical protein
MKRIRERLSYANVAATVALFLALGGTSYAVTSLPKNSVGSAQLRTNSVRAPEIERGAVRSSEIANGTIRLGDVSPSARAALQGQTGPPGPTFAATADSLGQLVRGNATGSTPGGFGVRLIAFSRSVASCVPTATLAQVAGGPNPIPPTTAHIQAETLSDGRVRVRTFDPAGAPQPYPFNLVVAC